MKKILLSLLLVFSYQLSPAQCGLKQIPLHDRATASDLIIEGKVIAKNSFWNAEHNMIYTSNTVEVYKIFKGSLNTTSIEILTVGGTVGLDRIIAEPSLNLNPGDIGVFTCETVKRFNVPNNKRSSLPQYEAFASSQGFVKYNLAGQTASDPFRIYNDIETELYKVVLAPSNKSWTTVIPFDIHNNESTQKSGQTPQINSISGFSPTTVTAGTGTTITITGTGFGSTQGSGTVGFKNADDGGATYINPLSTQYVSWSSTQIVVEVPSNAGTGTIQVTQGTTQTSSSTLTVDYAHSNVDFDPGTGTEAYETDHVNDNSSGGYTWRMNTGFDSDASAKASFLRAFDTWRCNTGVNWTIGSTTSINDAVSDGTNIICFDNTSPLSSGTLGVCYSYWSGCASGSTIVWYVNELDIIFDEGSNITPLTWEYGTSTPSSSEYDFETVALHELGHGHQLGHVINSGAIMHYAISNGTSNRVLGVNDLAGGNYVQAKSIVANVCGTGAMTNYTCATTPVAAFTGSPTTLCAGSSVTFTDQSTNTPTSWSWTFTGGTPSSSTSQNPTVTYSTAGTYAVSLTATNSAGSDVETKTAYITVNAAPTATTSQTNVSCNGGSTGSATVSASGGGGSYTYAWSPSGGTASTASSLSAGTYTCVITDANSCTVSKTVTITQPTALTVSANSTSPICNGSSVSLTSSASGGTGSVSYVWMPGSLSGSSVSASPTSTTTYTVTGTDANGCTDNATVAVTVNSLPTVSASSTSPICNGSSVSLTASGATTYTWMPGSLSGSSVSASPTSTTTYTVTGTNSNGCTNTATTAVTVNSLPTVSASASPSSISSGSSSSLTGSGASTYSWMPGSLSGSSVSVSPTSTTTYTVTGTSSQGCSNTANVTVTVSSTLCTSFTSASTNVTTQNMNTNMYITSASGATSVVYTFTPASGGTAITKTISPFSTTLSLASVSGLQYSETYSVTAQPYAGSTAGCVSSPATLVVSAPKVWIYSGCGSTFASLNTNILSTVCYNATSIEWLFTPSGGGTAITKTITPFTNVLNLSTVTGLQYGTTYAVQVRAVAGSVTGAYSTACNITIAAPTVNVTIGCGMNISTLNTNVQCGVCPGATSVDWIFTPTGGGTAITKTVSPFTNTLNLQNVTGLQYGTSYTMQVRATSGSVVGALSSSSCTLSIAAPAVSITKGCGSTVTNLNTYVQCGICPGATSVDWIFTPSGGGTPIVKTVTPFTNTLLLNNVTGIQTGTTYTMQVQVTSGSSTGSASSSNCMITIASGAKYMSDSAAVVSADQFANDEGELLDKENATAGIEDSGIAENVIGFPNPTSGIISIQSEEQINSISVYSLNGLLLMRTNNSTTIDLSTLPPACYFIFVQTATGYKRLKVIRE